MEIKFSLSFAFCDMNPTESSHYHKITAQEQHVSGTLVLKKVQTMIEIFCTKHTFFIDCHCNSVFISLTENLSDTNSV